jgi:hypothetical protein
MGRNAGVESFWALPHELRAPRSSRSNTTARLNCLDITTIVGSLNEWQAKGGSPVREGSSPGGRLKNRGQ